MGKTWTNSSRKYDEEQTSKRSGKHAKHSNNKKSGGMKTLNSYVEEDYDNPFEDDIELNDEIFIQHNTDNTNNTP
jgi:hypothetical protein